MKILVLALMGCFALPLGPARVHGQEPGVATQEAEPANRAAEPPPLTHYKGRKIAQTMHWRGGPWLLRPSREREENTTRLIESLQVEKGMTVCDLGCGNGYLSLRLAPLVGVKGAVIGVDIQAEMLEELMRRAKAGKHANLRAVEGTVTDPRLDAGSCDLIVLMDVYHEFSHPEHMLAAIRKALKPTGQLAMVEFRAEDPKVPIKPEHKMSKAQILKEIPPNGFRLVREFDALPWQHVMFFQRDDVPRKDSTGPTDPGSRKL